MLENYHENFEAWCRDCVTIADKESGAQVPFLLNAPQRRLVGIMERMRLDGKPIRIILLKARQWGGSTVVQMYMAWMQMVRMEGRNSLICGHVKDAAANIRGMYGRLLREYPERLKRGREKEWTLTPYEGSRNINYLAARDCCVAVASAQAPNAARGVSIHMAHLSEAAYWGDGDKRAANDIVRTVCGSVPLLPDTLVVMESTANGRDNYFYDEWERAVRGESDKEPVFVAWHEIEMYRRPVTDDERAGLLNSFDAYEQGLLDQGIDLEAVAWYHDKRREYATHAQMMAEYPGTAEEAFATSGRRVLTDDELPDVAEPTPADKPLRRLVVFLAGCADNEHVTLTVGHGSRGLYTLGCEVSGGRVHTAVERACALAHTNGCELMLAVQPEADGGSHSALCLRKARRAGTRLNYACSQSGCTELTPEVLADATDHYRDLAHEGLTHEATAEGVQLMADLRYPLAGGAPAALCRLLGALALADDNTQSAAPADFL